MMVQGTHTSVDAYDLWQSKTDRPDDYYRIPAFAVTNDGTLIAVTDLRYSNNSDLGGGHRIDLVIKRSEDGGKTWSDDVNITKTPDSARTGYGDAAIVADRDSEEALILCAHGDVRYPEGDKNKHLQVIAFTSHDGGKTFPDKKDISDMIFGLHPSWISLFFGSGRIAQSRSIKRGNRYRIYAALLSRGYGNAVVYSDDFGSSWRILGAPQTSPIPHGDEAKVEELPDGNVILSSRKDKGRYFSIFTYDDRAAGTGQWSPTAVLDFGSGQATNGEILIVKALKADTTESVSLVLQSFPALSSRKNVTIYWREIPNGVTGIDEFVSAEKWKSYLVEDGESGYSTMAVQHDGTIGFLYERNTRGYDYDIAYKCLPIAVITGGLYQ